jgi:carbonic anhydrase
LLEGIAEMHRCDALVELNVIEQVINVAQSTVLQDAWLRGQDVALHGWVYGIHDGLLQDMRVTVKGNEGLDLMYRAAIDAVAQARRG